MKKLLLAAVCLLITALAIVLGSYLWHLVEQEWLKQAVRLCTLLLVPVGLVGALLVFLDPTLR